MGIRVGIDLGTTFSAVARIDPVTGRPQVIKNGFGSAVTPSVLCFQRNGEVLYGEDAKSMQLAGDPNSIAFFKRSMGSDSFAVDILGRTYTATDLSAEFLKRLKAEAEQQCGEKIDAAVITVPAYFAHKERTATIEAGKRAGLEVLAIINEPTAAAFAYGLNNRPGTNTVMIYDLGGGTFDVTIAKITETDIDILGSDGDHQLGGKDWDDCIARYLASEFSEKYGVDITDDPGLMASLLVTAENTKKQLTQRDSVTVPITAKGVRGTVDITEQTFEEISDYLIGITKDVTERLLDDLKMGWGDIDGVILVGGSTRMRMIHDYVKEMSGKEPLSGVNVDEAVALGAAIRANITVTGAKLPGGRAKGGDTLRIQGAKAVNDVTAHSLGMIAISPDGEEYINSIIIKKNTKIPAANMRPFNFLTRAKDNELEVYVLQGEFSRPLDNTVINKYVITGIQSLPERKSVIEVTYEYTVNGVIQVSARQRETGKDLKIRIEPVPEDMSWTDRSPKENSAGKGMPDVDVMLTFDLSGSMTGTPLKQAKQAMKEFISQMDEDHVRIGLIPFASKVDCEQDPTDDYGRVKRKIDAMEISEKYGYGNSVHPFDIGYDKLKRSHADIRYIIVLTDGCWSCNDSAIRSARKCHAEGIEVMALGFGSADYNFLKKIASVEDFASLTDLSQLSSSFSKIAQAINEGSTGLSVL